MSSSINEQLRTEQIKSVLLDCDIIISHILTCPDAATSVAIIKNFRKDNGIEKELKVLDFLNPNLNPAQQEQVKSTEGKIVVLDIVPSNIQDIASRVQLIIDHHESNFKFLSGLDEKTIIVTPKNINEEKEDVKNISACALLYETLFGKESSFPSNVVTANDYDTGNFTEQAINFKALFDELCKSRSQVDFCESMLRNDHDFVTRVMDEGKRLHDEKQANIEKDVKNIQLQTVCCLSNNVTYKILTGPTHFSLVSEVAKLAFDNYPQADFSAHFMHKIENGQAKTQYFLRSTAGRKSLMEIYPYLPSGVGGSPFAGGFVVNGTFNGLPEDLFQLIGDYDSVPVNLNA